MKKTSLLFGSLLLLLASCGEPANNNQQSAGNNIENQTTVVDDQTTIKNLNEMVDYLTKEKLVYGEKSTPSYSMLSGAINGVKYNDDSDFYAEIYEYSAKAPTKATILGIEFTYSAVNGRFALIVNQIGSTTKTTKESALVDSFKKLNTK